MDITVIRSANGEYRLLSLLFAADRLIFAFKLTVAFKGRYITPSDAGPRLGDRPLTTRPVTLIAG